MPYWQAVEGFLAVLPVREVPIQERAKAGIMAGLNDMDHLVDDEVLEAFARLTGQFAVKADGLPRGAATSPLGLHPLNEESLNLHSDDWLPFFD